MKGKGLLAILLTFIMITGLLAGCGNSEGKTSGNTPDTAGESKTEASVPVDTGNSEAASEAQETPKASESADDNGTSGGAEGYNVTWEDTADITVMFCSMGPVPSGLKAVEDAVNVITEEEINTHVTLTVVEVGNYDQQSNLLMASGEQVDLMITMPGGPAGFSTMSSQNQLIDITDIVEDYAPSISEGIGEYLKGTVVNNRLYGVTAYKNFVSAAYVIMRTDVLEDLGLLEKAQNMTSFAEYEEILEAVKNSEKWNYLSGLGSSDGHGNILPVQNANLNADKFSECGYFDNLGDTQFIINIDPTGKDTQVRLNFETDEFRQMYDITRSWYEKGYIYKDSATTSEMATELVKSNVIFSYVNQMEIGTEASASINSGMDMTCTKIVELPVSTGSVTKFVWVVPTTAKEPEAAVTFLEMMYRDSRISNLLAWGIEGVDYEVGADGVAHYIEGNENPAYHGVDFLVVNQFNVLPWEGNDPDLREQARDIMKNSVITPYLGFVCDTSPFTTELSAVTNVINEYRAQITSGVADAQTFQAFLDKLHASGADKIVEAYQNQLDQWLEANGK